MKVLRLQLTRRVPFILFSAIVCFTPVLLDETAAAGKTTEVLTQLRKGVAMTVGSLNNQRVAEIIYL